MRRTLGLAALLSLTAASVLLAACGDDDTEASSSTSPSASESSTPSPSPLGTITLYTSVTQATVDAVVASYQSANPGATVEVYRAPTGEVNARVAADVRSGGLQADVIWGTDPLSMQAYADQDLLAEWPLPDIEGVPDDAKTETFWGTRELYVVMVAGTGVDPAPTDWDDLTDPSLKDAVAIPDPGFAGSSFAALGYFSDSEDYGLEYYQELKDNGAAQVASPPEVVTQVATGRYAAGITLDSEVRSAAAKGSPVTLVWPESGAIALYSPIASSDTTDNEPGAEGFLGFVLSTEGQEAIATSGWQPMVEGIPGPEKPAGATSVSPDWEELFGTQQTILDEYRSIFGG